MLAQPMDLVLQLTLNLTMGLMSARALGSTMALASSVAAASFPVLAAREGMTTTRAPVETKMTLW